ncbi:toll/interleukin-1 receptor domain-containing protein [Streptomyces sp. NBC_00448]|uniref:toll/interleukin-1 receptor domain-containing protein n=1 Tax=Streptomyces sp. NBC_00448 TaxID=2903652 RepID=UPI002E1D6CC9
MAWANLLVAVAAMATGVVATYFTYVTLRGQIRRRHDPPAPPAVDASAPPSELGSSYDVFISYAEADEPHAVRLAEQLRLRGLRIFLAKWIGPGLVEILEKERALLGSANGVLIFSRATTSDPRIMDEYAALLQRVHSGGRRFIPVLAEPVELPPFARIRVPLDLACGDAEYETRVDLLVRALRPTELGAGS